MKTSLEAIKKYITKRLRASEPHYHHFIFYSIGVIMLISLVMGVSLKMGTDFSIKVAHKETANVFTVMDQASEWKKDFCKVSYKNYWREKYPLSKEDKNYFAQYKKLREKYFVNPESNVTDVTKAKSGLFVETEALTEDPLGKIFYSSETLEEAFNKLSGLLTPDEVKFLQEFYQHFEKKYQPILEESKKLVKVAKDFSAPMQDQKLVSYLKKVALFYQSKLGENYTVLYVWAPLGKETNAFPVGDFLIMQCHPDTPIEKVPGPDVIVHEIIHTISARQSQEQKQMMTKVFLEKFKGAGKVEKLKILEEPLAVVWGQALYLKKFNPSLYKQENYKMIWYNHPWVNVYAQLLAPLMEEVYQSGETINAGLIETMADMGQALYLVTTSVGQRKSS